MKNKKQKAKILKEKISRLYTINASKNKQTVDALAYSSDR